MRTKTIKLSDDRSCEVRELPIGKFNKLLKAIKQLPSGIDLTNVANASEEIIGAKMMASIPGILADGWSDFMEAIVDSTSLSITDLNENINLADGTKIIEAMIEVNDIPTVVKTIGQWFKKSSPAIGSPT